MSETLANVEKIGGIDYSTEEQWTGLRWIDGKKIYQKTISVTAPSTSTDGTFVASYTDTGVGNLGVRWIVQGFWINTNGDYLTSPLFLTNAFFMLKATLTSDGKIAINNSALGFNGLTGYITIQYTKTTD